MCDFCHQQFKRQLVCHLAGLDAFIQLQQAVINGVELGLGEALGLPDVLVDVTQTVHLALDLVVTPALIQDLADLQAQIPAEFGVIPRLLDQVRPLHELVTIEYYLPGCPPPAPRIRSLLEQVLAGKTPDLAGADIQFG